MGPLRYGTKTAYLLVFHYTVELISGEPLLGVKINNPPFLLIMLLIHILYECLQ